MSCLCCATVHRGGFAFPHRRGRDGAGVIKVRLNKKMRSRMQDLKKCARIFAGSGKIPLSRLSELA